MHKLVKNNVSWVGYVDWEMKRFHGDDFSVNHGSTQNAYLIKEEKTVLIDTAWKPHSHEFVENLKKEVDLKSIDYIIMNHGEVDHSGSLPELMAEIPNTPIYCSQNAVKSLIGQFHHPEWDFHAVKTGDELDIGNGKKLIFVSMPMLHWPDSMATYMTGDNILFSNDAFGQHYAQAELFNDLADKEVLWREALKYYANILAPFLPMLKKKIEEIRSLNLPIDIIAPSHGVIWRENPMQIVDKYYEWADNYSENQITVVYDSMWDGTATIAHRIAEELKAASPDTVVKVMKISSAEKDDIMTEVFRSKAIAVGSPTIVNGIMASVSGWLAYLKELKFKNKKAAVFGCYGWSGEGNAILRESLDSMGYEVVEPEIKSYFNPTEEVLSTAKALAEALA
ncbi:MAG: MBL fold metallo-hydrolase [Lachnospiraceae bacterium]|nr:MBL fold metallo-hydrolase [Lachnospiraceae bacterium]